MAPSAVTVKFGLLSPSMASVKLRVPVTSPASSAPLPLVLPPKLPASLTWVTVMLITCVSLLPSSSVTVTVKLSLPLKFASGV
ncbi:hypothetical protein D3C83_69190 [compost metagenome]